EAFFASVQPREADIASQEEKAEHARRVKEVEVRMRPLRKQIAEIDAPHRAKLTEAKKAKLEPEYQQALAVDPRHRTAEQQRLAMNAQTLLKITWDEVLAVLAPADRVKRAELRRQL